MLPRIVDHLTVEVNNKVAGDLGYELCYHVGIEPPHWDYHEIDRIKSIRQKGNIGGVYLNVKCCKGTEQNEDGNRKQYGLAAGTNAKDLKSATDNAVKEITASPDANE